MKKIIALILGLFVTCSAFTLEWFNPTSFVEVTDDLTHAEITVNPNWYWQGMNSFDIELSCKLSDLVNNISNIADKDELKLVSYIIELSSYTIRNNQPYVGLMFIDQFDDVVVFVTYYDSLGNLWFMSGTVSVYKRDEK